MLLSSRSGQVHFETVSKATLGLLGPLLDRMSVWFGLLLFACHFTVTPLLAHVLFPFFFKEVVRRFKRNSVIVYVQEVLKQTVSLIVYV